ncbi:MAG: quinate 5-dehydrogenase [Thermanaeromonas sp.]|uniref:quinate 5-dehydrogenase n=1 Tax=Thermanaeromonas sp. TaxID=2003697 RepID=UPI0024377A60|nr:quinate 5-dehydrogenase [Thermanaeromonas sp.]MCG0279059.1 quinate 5-dehydrogenase [Thermanaeromonas sp.]
MLKRVVSISLGSSQRDHVARAEFLGVPFELSRIGTDGDMEKMISLIREMDGKVDAFGLGGMDLYLRVGSRKYLLRDAARVVRAAQKTPIVDGGGLKDTLERRIIAKLAAQGFDFRGKKALVVCAVDRFGLAEALAEAGAQVTCGDLIFGLGLPIPLRSLPTFRRVAYVVAPVVRLLPFKMLYPTGKEQEKVEPRYTRFYDEAEIIAGDFHFIRRFMPERLTGKIIITNTVTPKDIEELRKREIKTLITTTPEFQGRSFGTNVLEGVIVVLSGKRPEELTREDYNTLLDRLGFEPRILNF